MDRGYLTRKSRFLTIAGSDCSGGAGIQADIRTAGLLDFYPCSVITAVTAQNTSGVTDVYYLPHEIVISQLQTVVSDMYPDCIKIGMLGDPELIRKIANVIRDKELSKIVLDPVMAFTLGKDPVLKNEAVHSMVENLFPLVDIVTPNLNEAAEIERITGIPLSAGCKAYLLKGGHAEGPNCIDRLFISNEGSSEEFEYSHPKLSTNNTHGTGCVLSSAISCSLCKSETLDEAVGKAIDFLIIQLGESRIYKMGGGSYGPCLV